VTEGAGRERERRRYEGKTALVTGGGSGIGAAVARRLAAEGAQVTVVGRRKEQLREVSESYVVGDVSLLDDCERMLAATGPLDLLVNNAGIGGGESWAETMAINLTGPFQLTALAEAGLIERRGAIVNVASTAALYSGAGSTDYNTSKAGLLMLTRSLAVKLGPLGVRANTVCPGWIRTPMGETAMRRLDPDVDAAYALVTRHAPLRRAGTPDEMASIVAFLGSDDAAYVTGAVLMADGGSSAVDVLMVDYDAIGAEPG
jgi:meso-butanediol dehydrogenase / (S,S)-butanediol dehydrogenase / diacetyl reductase